MIGSIWMPAFAPDKSSRLFGEVLPWLILLIGVVLAGAIAIYYIRRSLKDTKSHGGGFTLQDLRDMHAAGELSDDEFERAKAQMIGRLRTPANSPDDSASTGNHRQSSS